jgi:hypothetical protein
LHAQKRLDIVVGMSDRPTKPPEKVPSPIRSMIDAIEAGLTAGDDLVVDVMPDGRRYEVLPDGRRIPMPSASTAK